MIKQIITGESKQNDLSHFQNLSRRNVATTLNINHLCFISWGICCSTIFSFSTIFSELVQNISLNPKTKLTLYYSPIFPYVTYYNSTL